MASDNYQQSGSHYSRSNNNPYQTQANPYAGQDGVDGATQRRSYVAQPNSHAAQNNPYATQGNPYAAQNNPYGAQANPYASQNNPYAAQNGGQYSGAGQYQTSSRGYVPPADNPYLSGPQSGAVGVTPERVSSQPKRGRFKTNGTEVGGYPAAPRKRKSHKVAIVVVLLVLVLLGGAGFYLWTNPPYYNVTINGEQRFVKSGMTIQEAIDEGYASPVAGNLLAIDGSVFQEGGGEPFVATINGETTSDGSVAMGRDAEVQIDNGTDVTEEYTETTQTIAHGTSGTDMSTLDTYWTGSIHVYSNGQDGEETVKTGTQSGVTLTEVTKEAVDAGYSSFTVNTGDDKVICLTFDDGPWPTTTDEILDILAENDAKATFFEIGNQCAEYSSQVKRIISEGHQIATHSYDHASGSGQGVNLTFMTAEEQRTEIEKGFSAIEEVAGTTVSHIMRAPGGNYYGSIITNLSDLVVAEIGWNVDTEDWAKPGVEYIKNAICSATSGQVVLMHDGGGDRTQTVEALRQALPELKAQGYSFITIDELLTKYTNIYSQN